MREGSSVQTPLPQLKYLYLVLGACGLVILIVLLGLNGGPPAGFIRWSTVGGILAAAVIGSGLRSIRRKIFHGPAITWDQSVSLEVIVQAVQLFSPLLPRRVFEVEFTCRETQLTTKQVDQWLGARQLSISVLGPSALAWCLGLLISPWAAVIPAVAALVILGWGLHQRRFAWPVAGIAISGLVIWTLEGMLFTHAVAPWLGQPSAWAAYFVFISILEYAPVPLAIGLGEVPAVTMPAAFSAAFWSLLLFHAAKVLLLSLLSAVFLWRFKFSLGDLFKPDILMALGQKKMAPAHPAAPQQGTRVDQTFVSIVIPAYNEESRLPTFLESVRRYMDAAPQPMDVIVVDDGSTDQTAAVVEVIASQDSRVRLIRQTPNQGKGAAVRRGVLAAEGAYILFADADGATPITELDKLLPLTRQDNEITIGSRYKAEEGSTQLRETHRKVIGEVFNTLVNLLAVPGIRDTQCGFKLFRGDAARELFARIKENGWAFDVEVLYLAQKMGYSIKEVGVNWTETAGSKVRFFRDSFRMFLAVFSIRNRHAGFLSRKA